MQPYINDLLNYSQATAVRSDCNAITFFNQGTTVVRLNNAIPIPPGGSISFAGNYNEIDRTIYNITFVGAGNNLCWVLRKVYIVKK
jgi:hypothetical protein